MPRRPQKTDEPKEDDFIVLFTALSMILLAFFIMLNSMATIDSARSRTVISSLVGTFGSMPGFEKQRTIIELDHERPGGQTQGEIERTLRQILNGELEELDIYTQDGRVVVSVGSALIFERGGTELSPKSFRTLDTLAGIIKSIGIPVRVEGHADPAPAKPPKSNWYYSTARAAAVHRYLVSGHQIPAASVELAGYADFRADRHGNKVARVEIIFLPEERP